LIQIDWRGCIRIQMVEIQVIEVTARRETSMFFCKDHQLVGTQRTSIIQFAREAKSQKGEKHQLIYFLHQSESVIIDETLTDGNSGTIDWRQVLRVSDLIDVSDRVGKWYEGTILRIQSDCLLIELLIHYNGWPQQWDEWIAIDSDRLARAHIYTNGPVTVTNALLRC